MGLPGGKTKVKAMAQQSWVTFLWIFVEIFALCRHGGGGRSGSHVAIPNSSKKIIPTVNVILLWIVFLGFELFSQKHGVEGN